MKSVVDVRLRQGDSEYHSPARILKAKGNRIEALCFIKTQRGNLRLEKRCLSIEDVLD